MKTAEELYKEITESEELQAELKNTTPETLEAFLKKYNCAASAGDFISYVRSQAEGEMEDDDAGTVAGGRPTFWGEYVQVSYRYLP